MPDRENGPTLESLLAAYRSGEVGRCVNSVTHDVNNALGVILAYAELIGMESALDENANKMLADIVDATRSASSHMAALTGVARPARAQPTTVAPVELLERVVSLRRFDAKRAGIEIVVDDTPELPLMTVEAPPIERALLFLLANAVDAAKECGSSAIECAASQTGSAVAFTINDGGPAIDEAVAAQMFEPYFTTKPEPHLGLGLCAAKQTAKENGGDLTYAPDAGFRFTLPRT